MSRSPLRAAGLGALLLVAPAAGAQQGAPAATPAASPATASRFEFTIANIMRGPEVYGREPSQVRWSPDGRWIYFQWLPPGSDWREELKPYRVRATAGATPERVTQAHMDSVGPLLAAGAPSPDRASRVVSWDGDLFLVDGERGRARRLTETLDPERQASFSSDGRRVYFVRDNNVFSIDLDGGLLRQLTDVRAGGDSAEGRGGRGGRQGARAEGGDAARDSVSQRGFLEEQQLELLETIRDLARADSLQRAERARRDSARVAPLFLGRTERLTDVAVSPAGTALLIETSVPASDARRIIVPNYVTRSGYVEDIEGRTKVGDEQSTGRVAFMTLPSGRVQWLQLIPGDHPEPPSTVQLVGWTPQGDAALVMAVSRDFKTRYLHQVNADGSLRTLDVLRDTAWVAGPCFGCAGWYDEGRRAYFVSEADGYAHLYSVAKGGGDRRQLTSGQFEVNAVDLSADGRSFELHTSEGSPFEQHFYRMPIAGGTRTRITTGVGAHDVTVSPDGRRIADVYSQANRPPELFVAEYRPGAELAQLTTSPTAAWLSHPWVKPEIVMIPASDGVQVPARIYTPQEWNARPNGAAVIFVHGAGYLHNVHNYWSTYSREYMFNQYLASKGYVVLDVDYRGSAGYGRDWRTAIYRWMGGRDLQDQVDASRYLQERFGIDPERIGMYGGSYGGFMTLMALFTEPKQFGAGAALRSVTDWAHYNHGYTGRILNLPQEDSLAYRRSSPIYFAQGLEDPLLMAHGMVDTNVNFQDIVLLTQRLIELGKTGWELAVYPVENHGFERPSSWTDEYRRIFELFETTLGPNAKRTTVGGSR
ncbi:MAG TPA: prolyl oligopeptidase family serine peptidase [Gemmatimonadaceae bacterium]|nr:prolyl oligopeptidase family serine peptidase [Gemmatimonadaceae bacterium]